MPIVKKLSPIALGFLLLITVWQLASVLGGHQAALFPPPLKVVEALGHIIADGSIFTHIQISLLRFFAGYLLAVIVAVVCGLLLGRSPRIWAVLDPIVQVLRPVSPIAWSPFIVLWFGIGNMPAIVIIFIAAFFPVLLSTVSAVRKVDKTYLRIAANFEMRPIETLQKIVLPASFPMIANGLHMALSLNIVMACIILIGFIGLLLDKGIHYFEAWVNRIWGGTQ